MKCIMKLLVLLLALCLACPAALADEDVGRGAKGDAVVEIQERLNQLGYDAGSADGQYGGKTEEAVKRFQKINRLPETGTVDEQTRALLFSEEALDAKGKSAPADPDIVRAQRLLRMLGGEISEITGKRDEATVAALTAYQRAHQLQPTGEVNPATLENLGAEVAEIAADRLLVNDGDAEHPLYGYADAAGEIVIPLQFTWASGEWGDGLARVTFQDGKSGYIDINGDTALTLARVDAGTFSDGIAIASRDGHIGYIDMNGDFAWPLSQNKLSSFMCTAFAEGRARVGEKLIDRLGGTYATPLDMKDVASMMSTGTCEPFCEGLMCLRKSTEEGRKYGYIDVSGKEAIPFQFDYAESFSEGLAVIGDESSPMDVRYGYIDPQGEVVIPCRYDQALPFHEGLGVAHRKQDGWGTLDAKGAFTAAAVQWDAAVGDGFREGLLAVEMDGLVGFVNTAGELVIPCAYVRPEDCPAIAEGVLASDRLYTFVGGVCLVPGADGELLYIDAAGEVLFSGGRY